MLFDAATINNSEARHNLELMELAIIRSARALRSASDKKAEA
jgi:hypothetical protein